MEMPEVEFPGVFRLQRFARTSALQPIFELALPRNLGRLDAKSPDENQTPLSLRERGRG
jgi:hypothetical protein